MGLDSLHVLQLGLALQDRFDIEVPSTLLTVESTVADLLGKIGPLVTAIDGIPE